MPTEPTTTPEAGGELSTAKRALLAQQRRSPARGGAQIPRLPRNGMLPLSLAQQRLWFMQSLEQESGFYNIAKAAHLRGPLDAAALIWSLNEIVKRHESLRTAIVDDDGRAMQAIAANVVLPVPLLELRELSPAEREAEVRRLALAEAETPFDLACAPLMRACLARLADEEHVLFLTIHHIVADGWSLGVLCRELGALYRAYRAGRESPLPGLAIQYADFAVWQRQRFDGGGLDQQLAYWKRRFDGDLPVLELPLDPSPDSMRQQRHAGACVTTVLGESQLAAMRALSKRAGTTLFVTLLTAFQMLLSRLSGQEDIVVGTPIAGRNHPETKALIGFFISTLALRADLAGNPAFTELLQRNTKIARDAYANQDLPFEKLVEELHPERRLDKNPIFDVMINYFPERWQIGLQLDDLIATELLMEERQSKFAMTLYIQHQNRGLIFELVYRRAAFSKERAATMLEQYVFLLEQICAAPEQRIGSYSLVTAAMRSLLPDPEWNNTATDYPSDRRVHELFEEQIRKTPDAVALVCEDRQLSYSQLNSRANRLAHHLISLGVGPEVLIGICAERSIEMVSALLGILKAGGAYLPLDPDYPKERLSFMLEDAQVAIVVTQKHLEGRLPQHRAQRVYIDTPDCETYPDTNPDAIARSDHLAYVIYTSGSTGRPKGVMIEHRCLVNYIQAAARLYRLQPEDGILQFASISFDVSVREIFMSLTSGATLVLCPDPRMDAERFFSSCRDWRITLLSLPTAYWHGLANAIDSEGVEVARSLRLISAGGEKMLADRLAIWRRAAPHLRLINSYGPTETTVSATAWEAPHDREMPAPIPIGRPLANTTVYILDPWLNPVPIGVPGEIHIGGAGLARGYLNRPELSEEKFIANPFSGEFGARLYKTGDRGRYLPDGNIEFLGRFDEQVKIRGFRVEPGEIEAVLHECPDVKACAVLSREDTPGDKRLVAYVVPNEAACLTPGDFRDFLRQKLPGYMLPSTFVLLNNLPITANGKLDRKALPPPDQTRDDSAVAYVAPRTPTEEKLSAIFCEVLKLDRVGIRDNFFDLGGHSFLVLRVLAEIEKACGTRLSIATLFQAPTVEEIGQILSAGEPSDDSGLIVPLNPYGTTPPLFSVWMGIATELRELSRCLGPDQRMYGISSHWDPKQMPITRIEEMAAYYLTHLRKIQPQGPYYLSSDCLATLIALEMAQQLNAQGEEIAALILIDPLPPRTWMKPSLRSDDYRSRVKRHLHSLANLSVIEQFAHLSVRTLKALWGRVALRVCLALRLPLSRSLLSRYVIEVHQRAKNNYVPKAYSGKIWFIWAADDMDATRRGEIQKAWSQLAAQATHRTVPGLHVDVFKEPYVGPLAEQVKICLAEARTAPHPGVESDAAERRRANVAG